MVTGAGGFIGRHLTRRLERDGDDVTALAVDARDTDAVQQTLADAQPHVVFHLAGTATRAGTQFDVNHTGTVAVLDAVLGAGAPTRVVIVSTDALTWREPTDAYDHSKAAAERAGERARTEHGLDVVVVRLANVYGPGDPRTERLVPAASLAAVAGTRFEPDAPSAVLDLVHVDDVAAALGRLKRESAAPLLRVASGGHVTAAAVAECIGAIARGEAPAGPDVSPYNSSVPLVSGWIPRITLLAGLEGTVRWYIERADNETDN
jgi:nucleoside-diphosphate-sugar epimerase